MVVLPLLPARRALRLDATCLVIGSMAPDFEYFVRGDQVGALGHTVRGIALWSVPATLVLALAWHHLAKRPLALVAPRAIVRRVALRPWPRWTLGALASYVISAALGAASHLVWDSFTHAKGWGVRVIPSLGAPVTAPLLGHTVVFRVLQYGSSLVGLAVVAIVCAIALRRRPPHAAPPPDWPARAIYLAVVAAGIAAMAQRLGRGGGDLDAHVVQLISGLLAGMVVASALLLRRARGAFPA